MSGLENLVLPILASGRSRIAEMGDHFRKVDRDSGGSEFVVFMLILFGLVVLVGFAASYWQRRATAPFRSPRRLLGELCRSKQIKRKDRRLLKSIAIAGELEHPARLFLETALWSPEPLNEQQRERLPAIKQIVFGGEESHAATECRDSNVQQQPGESA